MSGGWTPGPWRVDPRYPADILGADGADVAETTLSEGYRRPLSVQLANAKLVGAAPELYEALAAFNLTESAILGGTATSITLRVPFDVIQRAAAALAKARGETP